jgi:uncharacterized protein
VIGAKRRAIVRLANRYGAKNLRVFGSVARKEASEKSDLDLLVEWKRPHSLLDRAALAGAIGKLIGRNVDVVPEESLYWWIEPTVIAEAVPL